MLSMPRRALAPHLSLSLAAALSIATMAVDTAAAAPPDSGLYTSYSLGPGFQSVNWLVCGDTQEAAGCYDQGTMSGFGQVAAMIEGAAKVNAAKGTVTREIYVCDVAAGSGTSVTLYDYTKTDVVTATDDAATVVLKKAIPTTLVGGANSACQMAANPVGLFVAVNGGMVAIAKGNDTVVLGGPGENVTSITADGPGYLTIDYSNDSFYGYSPAGGNTDYGGGNYFKVGTGVSTSLANVPMYTGTFPANPTHVMPGMDSASTTAATGAPIDITLFTDYYVFSAGTIQFQVCGNVGANFGCFGSSGYGPFVHPGSIMEGARSYNGGTVTRHVYVCDDATGSGTGVTLYDYKRTDVITTSSSTTTIKRIRMVPLPLVGGANASCTMAGDYAHLFVGTRNSTSSVEVTKGTYAVTSMSGLDPSLHFATATADNYGFAATMFGSPTGTADVNTYDPTGNPGQSTGGAWFLLGTENAVQTTLLPTTEASFSNSLLNVRLTKPAR